MVEGPHRAEEQECDVNNFKSGQGINKQGNIHWKEGIAEKRETSDTTALKEGPVGFLRETRDKLMLTSSCCTGLRPGEQLLGCTVLCFMTRGIKCFENFSLSVLNIPIRL